jgi:hypothetical protein
MSKGLGRMQHAIMDNLDTAQAYNTLPNDIRWFWYSQVIELRLAEGVYDLRQTSRYLRRLWHIDFMTERRFQAAFSRAVRTLIARKLLEPVTMVPIVDEFTHYGASTWFLHHLADGTYWIRNQQQTRFVKRYGHKDNT